MDNIDKVITQCKAESIMRDVADYFGVSYVDLLSPKRHKRLVEARCVISYILYVLECCTYEYIGGLLNRTHSAIIHQERVANRWLENPKFNQHGAKAIETIVHKYYE